MKLDDRQLEAARRHLLGEGSDALIRFMASQSVALKDGSVDEKAEQLARDLGWIDTATGKRTATGIFVSDSCREYLFWLGRDKALPFEGALPHLTGALFQDKYIVEIGAGMGPNLMSLAGRAGRLCGVEPVEAYAQLGAIFCARDGIAPPDMRIGSAESMPFGDNEVDLVLCITAHQYFDIRPALAEIARVLKPGGELVVIGAVFSSYAGRTAKRAIRSRGGAKTFGVTLANTLGYMALGRRIFPSRSGFTTSRPIYPTRAAMTRWMRQAGLQEAAPPGAVGPETCFYARRK